MSGPIEKDVAGMTPLSKTRLKLEMLCRYLQAHGRSHIRDAKRVIDSILPDRHIYRMIGYDRDLGLIRVNYNRSNRRLTTIELTAKGRRAFA
jgi:hypothetical protein